MTRKKEKVGMMKVALGPDFDLPRTIHRVAIEYEEYFAFALSNQSSESKTTCRISVRSTVPPILASRGKTGARVVPANKPQLCW